MDVKTIDKIPRYAESFLGRLLYTCTYIGFCHGDFMGDFIMTMIFLS